MIVKIWPVKADCAGEKGKVGGTKGLKNALNYIMDPAKNLVLPQDLHSLEIINEHTINSDFDNLENLDESRVLNYMANKKKTEGHYITGYLCDPETALKEFRANRNILSQMANKENIKETGALAFHIVQSFPEGLDISDEEVHQCGIELCKKINAHQAVICSHVHPEVDELNGEVHGKSKHNHILINAYMHPSKWDPKNPNILKYHDCKETYAMLRVWNDEIAIEHGLPIIRNPDEKRTYSWWENEKANKGLSWKEKIRIDIEAARRASSDWESFQKLMKSHGYRIKEKANVSYTAPDGKHIARDKTLGQEYTKESLEQYWSIRKQAFKAVEEAELLNPIPTLLDIVKGTDGPLMAAIPIGKLNQAENHFSYVYLECATQSQETLTTYFDPEKLYDICDENHQPIAAATGQEILEGMEQLRKGKEFLSKKIDLDSLNFDNRFYTYHLFINTRTRKPYRTSLYDQNVRRRSILELMFLLAITVITKEDVLWNTNQPPRGQENEPIYSQKDWKIQNMIDSIYVSKQEGIETPAQLDQRLNEAGAAYSRTRSALQKMNRAKEKMDTINEALTEYEEANQKMKCLLNKKDGTEKEKNMDNQGDLIQKINAAKAVLYRYKITEESQISDFKNRYTTIQKDISELEEKFDQAKETYRKLKKLKYNVALSQNVQYCYGPEYTHNQDRNKEQKEEPMPNVKQPHHQSGEDLQRKSSHEKDKQNNNH